jgi:hypothetical protein
MFYHTPELKNISPGLCSKIACLFVSPQILGVKTLIATFRAYKGGKKHYLRQEIDLFEVKYLFPS